MTTRRQEMDRIAECALSVWAGNDKEGLKESFDAWFVERNWNEIEVTSGKLEEIVGDWLERQYENRMDEAASGEEQLDPDDDPAHDAFLNSMVRDAGRGEG